MEAGWGRGVDFVRLSTKEIDALIAPSGLRAVGSSLIAEGHANTNYRLQLGDGSQAALRIYQREPAVAELEETIALRLADEIPVPRVIFREERRWSLLEWKPGRTLETLLLEGQEGEVLRAASDIGWGLAVTSSVTFDQAGFLALDLTVSEAWPSTADGLFDYVDFLLDQDLVRKRAREARIAALRPVMDRARREVAALQEPPCLVHGDYKATNLLIDNGRLTGVLDWEFAHSGTWLMSIGQIFRHPLPDGFEERFVEGLGEERIFPGWRDLARKIDLLSMLDFLNRPASDDARIAGVLRIVDRTLESLTSS